MEKIHTPPDKKHIDINIDIEEDELDEKFLQKIREMQDETEALKKLGSSIRTGGFIALGIKESIEFPGVEKEFVILSDSEKIYKKR